MESFSASLSEPRTVSVMRSWISGNSAECSAAVSLAAGRLEM